MKTLLNLFLIAILVCSFGICFAEEQVVKDPVKVDPVVDIVKCPPLMIDPSIITGTIQLGEGWNLIGVPVFTNIYTVSQFINAVEERSPEIYPILQLDRNMPPYRAPWWIVRLIAVYKDGGWEILYASNGSISDGGNIMLKNDYNMVPGEAYFVYLDYRGYPIDGGAPKTAVKVSGTCIGQSVSLDLNKGWTGASVLVHNCSGFIRMPVEGPITVQKDGAEFEGAASAESYPPNPPGVIEDPKIRCAISYNLGNLSYELDEQGIVGKMVAFWNNDRQEWETYELPYPKTGWPGHIPPPMHWRVIRPDEGFFIFTGENGVFVPNGKKCKIEYPYPPRRATATGWVTNAVSFDCLGYPFYLSPTQDMYPGIPMDGAMDEIKRQLSILSDTGLRCTVEGYYKNVEWYGVERPGLHQADVLMVETVAPADLENHSGQLSKFVDDNGIEKFILSEQIIPELAQILFFIEPANDTIKAELEKAVLKEGLYEQGCVVYGIQETNAEGQLSVFRVSFVKPLIEARIYF